MVFRRFPHWMFRPPALYSIHFTLECTSVQGFFCVTETNRNHDWLCNIYVCVLVCVSAALVLLHAWAPERLSRENDATENAETTICDARPARASLHPGLKQQTNAGPTDVKSGSKRKKIVPEQERETQIAAGHESPSGKPNEKLGSKRIY
jgi:hypothetical protein